MPESPAGDGFTPLPNVGQTDCFGCSPNNPSGMYMNFHINEPRDTVVSRYVVPDFLCGWGDVVHGGIVSTMLDEAMGWACTAILRRFLLSKSMEVTFLKPVFTGREIRVEGSVLEQKSDREAVMQGFIYNDRNELCARSTSVVSLFSLEALKKIGLIDDDMLASLKATGLQ